MRIENTIEFVDECKSHKWRLKIYVDGTLKHKHNYATLEHAKSALQFKESFMRFSNDQQTYIAVTSLKKLRGIR